MAHITLILKSLHWLPVYFRIDFKILLLVFKALNGLSPYLSDLLLPYEPSRTLGSSDRGLAKKKKKKKARLKRCLMMSDSQLCSGLQEGCSAVMGCRSLKLNHPEF